MAATGTSLSYNGFSAFTNVEIGRFEHVPDEGPDRGTRGVTRHVVEGTAIVTFTGTGSGSIEQKIADLAARLNRNGMALALSTTDTSGSSHAIIDIEGDDKTGPYPSVRIDRIIGANNAATVSWSFEWFKTYQGSGSALSLVREFVMVSTFDVDGNGMTVITKNGHITLAKSNSTSSPTAEAFPPTSATPSVSGSYPYGYASTWDRKDAVPDYPQKASGSDPTSPFPEQYRRIVAGNLYPGFRRVSQQFVTDESRTRMVFRIIDQEFPRGLPAPARATSVNFSYERALPTSGGDMQALGTKEFSATIEGPTNVAPVDMLILAMRLSQKRIFWSKTTIDGTAYDPDIIQRIRVEEHDMLNRNAITFSVTARGTAEFSSGIGSGGTKAMQTGKVYNTPSLLSNILGALSVTASNDGASSSATITFTFEPASQPDAYGEFGAYRVTPLWYDPELSQAQKSWNTTQVLASADKANATYVFPNAVFDSHYSSSFSSDSQKLPLGKDNSKTRRDEKVGLSASDKASPYVHIEATERRMTDTGLGVMSSMALEAADLTFQYRKPKVYVHQRAVMVRLNKSPDREFLAREAGARTLHEEFVTHGGVSDGVNNRLMGAVHERTYVIADGGGSSTTSQYTNGTSGYRQAWPNNLGDNATLTALGDSQSAGDIPLQKMATRDPQNGDPVFKHVFGAPESWTA